MKNLMKTIGALLMIITFTQNSNAQTSVGGGLTFFNHKGGSDFGLNLKAGFGLNETMEISPSFNYYFVDGYTAFDINADFHYLFGDEGSFRFYPLAGVNFYRSSTNGFSNSEIQLSIGGGIKYPLNDNMNLFGEGKYMIGDVDGLVFSAGILFSIGG